EFQVCLEIGRFEMFFRITGYAYAEIGSGNVRQFFIEVNAVVHVYNLLQQVKRKGMSSRLRHKILFGLNGISSKKKHIVDAEKVKVNQCVFSFFPAEAAANKMRDGIHMILIHNGGTDADSTRPFANADFF